jgi:hypothetical protein
MSTISNHLTNDEILKIIDERVKTKRIDSEITIDIADKDVGYFKKSHKEALVLQSFDPRLSSETVS